MTYHQLQLTLHVDHALVQHEIMTLASFLQVPWRALRNQLDTWEHPVILRRNTTVASRVTLPDPYLSHQAGIYILEAAFQPDSLKRPLESCHRAKCLHERLDPLAYYTHTPTRYHVDAVAQQAYDGTVSMVETATLALVERGYTVRHQSLALHFLPRLSLVSYCIDAVEPHVHNGYGKRGRFHGIPISLIPRSKAA